MKDLTTRNKLIWFEVYTSDEEEGTETIASFDEEQQAKDYIKANPEMNLDYDKWFSNSKTGENEKF